MCIGPGHLVCALGLGTWCVHQAWVLGVHQAWALHAHITYTIACSHCKSSNLITFLRGLNHTRVTSPPYPCLCAECPVHYSSAILSLYTTPVQYSPLYTTPVQYSPLYTTPVQYSPLYTTPVQYSPLYTTPVQYSPIHVEWCRPSYSFRTQRLMCTSKPPHSTTALCVFCNNTSWNGNTCGQFRGQATYCL